MKCFLYIAFLGVLFFSCDNNALEKINYPVLKMTEATTINGEGAILKAEVYAVGNIEVEKAGFFWGPKYAVPPHSKTFERFFASTELKEGSLEFLLERDLTDTVTYEIWYGAETENEQVSSNRIEFNSTGSKWNPWRNIELPEKIKERDFDRLNVFMLGDEMLVKVRTLPDYWTFNFNENKWQEHIVPQNSPVKLILFFSTSKHIQEYDEKQVVARNEVIYEIDMQNHTSDILIELSHDICDCNFKFKSGGKVYFDWDGKMYSYNASDNEYAYESEIPVPASMFSEIKFAAVDGGHMVISLPDGESQFWKYDSGTNSWEQKTNYPGPSRSTLHGSNIGGRVFFGMGKGEGAFNIYDGLWEYITEKDDWEFIGWAPVPNVVAKTFSEEQKGFLFFMPNTLYEFDVARLSDF